MELTDFLYKYDNNGYKRLSKTKTISLAVFIIFFLFSIYVYLTTPDGTPFAIEFIVAIIVGLIFAVPTYLVGWVLSKVLGSDNKAPVNQQNPYQYNNQNQYQQQYNQQVNNDFNRQQNHNLNQNRILDFQPKQDNTNFQQNNTDNMENIQKTNDDYQPRNTNNINTQNYVQDFQKAIEENNVQNAERIISSWNDDNDANYIYARIIFYGMPPTNLSKNELTSWLQRADSSRAVSSEHRPWFRETALKVINLQ